MTAMRTACALGAALFLASPVFAQQQTADPALVTERVEVPAIDALQAPSERVGEYFETEDGARIFYEVAGDGPPMLLLHGYPLSGALFARVRDALQDDYTVLTVDHRGYGLSEAPEIPQDIGTYANDALAVMDHLGFDAAIIGGMSMGGPIALSMYEQAPERFEGLVLIDTTASAAGPAEAGLWQGVAEVARSAGKQPIITTLLPDMLTGETRLNEPAVTDYLTAIMQGSSVDGFIGGAVALAERPDFTDLLPEIDVPTLVVVGLEDSLYAVQVARGMVEQMPNAELAIIPGGSHAAVFEAPGHVGSAIQEWAGGM
ncbi:alpha/beta fold hydrolase [Citreimonas salinaria]|uniref:Pimeloyl-ACP methyl ester carboxylesterase n=1 Tax=Citreimonas salinaria TaxID=321339 RepID=A0A1H3NUT5_9RHOB|nr:alpha/beta fold hydrolase [Citreimonas salinaria]SDY92473.1 Pimeloyl-ACP methyl ester carboxylesterase [Citreimonas salinaria]